MELLQEAVFTEQELFLLEQQVESIYKGMCTLSLETVLEEVKRSPPGLLSLADMMLNQAKADSSFEKAALEKMQSGYDDAVQVTATKLYEARKVALEVVASIKVKLALYRNCQIQ